MALLKVEFFLEKFIGLESEQMKIPTLLDEGRLDVSTFFFKIIMKSNHVATLEPPLPCNLVIRLGPKLNLVSFTSLTFKLFCIGGGCDSYSFRECGRQMLLLHLIFHEIKVIEVVKNTP